MCLVLLVSVEVDCKRLTSLGRNPFPCSFLLLVMFFVVVRLRLPFLFWLLTGAILFLEATCSSSIFTLALQGQVLLIPSISDFCLRIGKVIS